MDSQTPAAGVLPYAGMLLWAAAAATLLLLCLSEAAAEIWSGRRRDGGPRLLRAGLLLLMVALGALPPLLIQEPGAAFLLHALFFPLLCYRLGRKTGWQAGHGHAAELLGVESRENLEDAQERLFESQMRLASRMEVAKSIAELAKSGTGEGARRAGPDAGARGARLDMDRGDPS